MLDKDSEVLTENIMIGNKRDNRSCNRSDEKKELGAGTKLYYYGLYRSTERSRKLLGKFQPGEEQRVISGLLSSSEKKGKARVG
jgi:hypothetical protein